MIPLPLINEWRPIAPWSSDAMVEQDLIISRLLTEFFNHPEFNNSFAFRGGTAIYKLFSSNPTRYSEDIDLVQVRAEPIGSSLSIIRSIADPLLGKPKHKASKKGTTLTYSFISETENEKSPIKIEINTREHFSVFGWEEKEFQIKSKWHTGKAKIITYQFDELMGTKLRAFYERDKGRDLFDLWFALQQPNFSPEKSVEAFQHYIKEEGKNITRAMFEMNFAEKQSAGSFAQDISPLLAPDTNWDFEKAAIEVYEKFMPLLPGDGWKG